MSFKIDDYDVQHFRVDILQQFSTGILWKKCENWKLDSTISALDVTDIKTPSMAEQKNSTVDVTKEFTSRS